MLELKCPICRHELIQSENLYVVDKGVEETLILHYNTRPQAKVFKKPERSPIAPRVCVACGYIALFMKMGFQGLLKKKQAQLGEQF